MAKNRSGNIVSIICRFYAALVIVIVSILIDGLDGTVVKIARVNEKKFKKKVFRSRLKFHHCQNLRVLHR